MEHVLSKGAKIRNRYNQVPHLTQDTNGKAWLSMVYILVNIKMVTFVSIFFLSKSKINIDKNLT